MAETTYIVNVEGAIVRDGRYLMIVRGQGETHAAGALAFVGGKVEAAHNCDDVLEATLQREIQEEVGVQVSELAYVQSTHFIAGDQDLVVDVVFLCRYDSGEPRIADAAEVADILWLPAAQVLDHPLCPPWTKSAMQRAEALRQRLGW